MIRAMNCKSDCWDNAPTESWFGIFESERVCGERHGIRVHRGILQPEMAAFDIEIQATGAISEWLAACLT